MKISLSEMNCSRGAPMGRTSYPVSGKCRLQQMRMVDGAYDEGGAYWGCGDHRIGWMYVCEDAEGNQFFTRATTRQKAKDAIMNDMFNENVTFYR